MQTLFLSRFAMEKSKISFICPRWLSVWLQDNFGEQTVKTKQSSTQQCCTEKLDKQRTYFSNLLLILVVKILLKREL